MQNSDGFEIPCSGTLSKHTFLSESSEDLEKISLPEMVSLSGPFVDCFGLGAN